MAASSSTPALPIRTILILALLSAVAPLATDMYLPAFPTMSEDLGAGATGIQLTLTSFLIGLAAGQLLIGPLSDRFGRRRPLLIGTAVAVVAGLLCAFAPDAGTLAMLRLLQGLGGAAGVVLARAIIADRTSDAAASARLFQIMMIIGGLAPVLAPIVGTGIVALAGWRAVFVVLALLSAISFAGVLRHVEETLPETRRIGGSIATLFGAMGQVLGNRAYLGYALTTSLTFMVLFAYISASPFVIQGILGLSPAAYSIVFGVNAFGIAAVSAVSAKLVGRVSLRVLTGYGLAATLVASLAVLGCVVTGAGAGLMLPALFVTVASVGLILGNASALAIAEAPQHAGTASAVLGALQFCLGGIASPLVGLAGKGSALPMALTMVGAAVLAIICLVALAGRGLRSGNPAPAGHGGGAS